MACHIGTIILTFIIFSGSHASTVSSDASASYAANSHHCVGKKHYNFATIFISVH